ncbi:MAG: hypothetical protein ACK5LC_14165 [Coprobacillaceae bacterium]
MNRKKVSIIILLCFSIILGCIYLLTKNNNQKTSKDTSNSESKEINDEITSDLLSKGEILKNIIMDDAFDGYSLSKGIASLSKDGVKKYTMH